MIRLASDQNFNHDILRGLLRRLPNLDVRGSDSGCRIIGGRTT